MLHGILVISKQRKEVNKCVNKVLTTQLVRAILHLSCFAHGYTPLYDCNKC